jgi:hypothetical protein
VEHQGVGCLAELGLIERGSEDRIFVPLDAVEIRSALAPRSQRRCQWLRKATSSFPMAAAATCRVATIDRARERALAQAAGTSRAQGR